MHISPRNVFLVLNYVVENIAVSMIEDTSGNQTLKCVGTYKAPAQAQAATQISPLLINKQVIS